MMGFGWWTLTPGVGLWMVAVPLAATGLAAASEVARLSSQAESTYSAYIQSIRSTVSFLHTFSIYHIFLEKLPPTKITWTFHPLYNKYKVHTCQSAHHRDLCNQAPNFKITCLVFKRPFCQPPNQSDSQNRTCIISKLLSFKSDR